MNNRGADSTLTLCKPYSLLINASSSRAIVFNHDGSIRAIAQQEFQQIFPQRQGGLTPDPKEIWKTQIDTAHEALKKAGLERGRHRCNWDDE